MSLGSFCLAQQSHALSTGQAESEAAEIAAVP